MSSYNFLKAVSDGLAEAIRYRTNLKRKRREEEYNYNRDWQRNENEYQRDLQRKKDWLDYSTNYNAQQEQKQYDLGIERKNAEREAETVRNLDFLNNVSNPVNINRHSYEDVMAHNTYNSAYGMPYAVKYEQSPDEIRAELEAQLKLKNKYADRAGQAQLARQKALVDYRNAAKPKEKDSLLPYKDWLKFMNLPATQETYSLWRTGKYNAPRAVKGGNGVEKVNESVIWRDKDLDSFRDDVVKARESLTKLRENNQIDLQEYLEKRNVILNDTKLSKEEKRKELEKLDLLMAVYKNQNAELENQYTNTLNESQINYKNAVENLYDGYTASGTEIISIPTRTREQTQGLLNDIYAIDQEKEALLGLPYRKNNSNVPLSVASNTQHLPAIQLNRQPQNSWQFK